MSEAEKKQRKQKEEEWPPPMHKRKILANGLPELFVHPNRYRDPVPVRLVEEADKNQ